MAEEKQKLEESIREREEGKVITYSLDEVWERLGLEREEKDQVGDELERKLLEATFDYENYCKNKELDKIARILKG